MSLHESDIYLLPQLRALNRLGLLQKSQGTRHLTYESQVTRHLLCTFHIKIDASHDYLLPCFGCRHGLHGKLTPMDSLSAFDTQQIMYSLSLTNLLLSALYSLPTTDRLTSQTYDFPQYVLPTDI